jgi:hypothetical protein
VIPVPSNTAVGSTVSGIQSLAIINANQRPDLTLDEKRARDLLPYNNRVTWARIALNLPAAQPKVVANQSKGDKAVDARANFFRVSFTDDAAISQLRRYRINLGKIGDDIPTQRNARKALIKKMLSENVPDIAETHYATDYYSHTISVGKLYASCGDTRGNSYNVYHSRPQGGTDDSSTGLVETTLVYEGILGIHELLNHVTPGQLDRNYSPDEDLKSLNTLSWKNVVSDNFSGARIGKKFFTNAATGAFGECQGQVPSKFLP